jgi:predicted nuclease of predicted toxin-antitoxin system
LKILLDQSAPRKIARFLPGHEVKHTAQLGWEEVSNGHLLKLAEENGYVLLITADQNIPYQNTVVGPAVGRPRAFYEQLEPVGALRRIHCSGGR